jgi:hypothetical protein
LFIFVSSPAKVRKNYQFRKHRASPCCRADASDFASALLQTAPVGSGGVTYAPEVPGTDIAPLSLTGKSGASQALFSEKEPNMPENMGRFKTKPCVMKIIPDEVQKIPDTDDPQPHTNTPQPGRDENPPERDETQLPA